MLDDRLDLARAAAAHAVDLFDKLPVLFDQARIQRMHVAKSVEVGERDAVVQVVRAGGQDVLAGRRRLARHHWIDVGIEEERRQPNEQTVERLAVSERKRCARARRCMG
ncbi:MAG TPA: hypothetical protein VKB52_06625, partial [Rhodanobacteraceae bacterium]|nr:hypothetical protein [Rhodanobacteraceae bacterium]